MSSVIVVSNIVSSVIVVSNIVSSAIVVSNIELILKHIWYRKLVWFRGNNHCLHSVTSTPTLTPTLFSLDNGDNDDA